MKKKFLSLTKTLMFQMHFILLAVKKAKGLKIKGKDGELVAELHHITQIVSVRASRPYLQFAV